MSIFKFEPVYKKRIWGGQQFQELFNPDLNKDEKFGESWNLVDRQEDQSICTLESGETSTLRNLIENNCKEIMGPAWSKNKKFPILVKWLDCQERLSLQVHPPENIARKLKGEPKTENWYVVKAKNNAGLFLGFKKGVSKEQFKEALNKSAAEKLCHRISSKSNDSVFVESGRMHAIDAGNLILEIQQNSDTTYRVYDWGRCGLDGNPRDLHIEESLDSINFHDHEPTSLATTLAPGIQTIAECNHFRIRKFNLNKGASVTIKETCKDCSILSPLKGELLCNNTCLSVGYSSISPYSSACKIQAEKDSSFLITDRFSGLLYT